MRPAIRFLTDELIEKIVSEATDILCTLGIEIQNKTVLTMLADCGCRIDMEKHHAVLTPEIIDKALKAAPESFGLYDVTRWRFGRIAGIHFQPSDFFFQLLDALEQILNLRLLFCNNDILVVHTLCVQSYPQGRKLIFYKTFTFL